MAMYKAIQVAFKWLVSLWSEQSIFSAIAWFVCPFFFPLNLNLVPWRFLLAFLPILIIYIDKMTRIFPNQNANRKYEEMPFTLKRRTRESPCLQPVLQQSRMGNYTKTIEGSNWSAHRGCRGCLGAVIRLGFWGKFDGN